MRPRRPPNCNGSVFKIFLIGALEDVLHEAETKGWPIQEIATQFLTRCCLSDGKFNNFQAGFLAVMTFLNEQLHPPGDQAYKDLAQILQTAGNENAIRRWTKSCF